MDFLRHIDEVDDDDAAEIAQAKFAGDGVAGFEVSAEDGFIKIARADKAAVLTSMVVMASVDSMMR